MKKLVSTLLLFVFCNIASAQKASFLDDFAEKPKKDVQSESIQSKRIKHSQLKKIKKLEEENKILKSIALTRMATPYLWENPIDINATDIFKGRLKFSILSTNLQSPMDVSLDPSEVFPNGAIIKCQGATSYKRVAGLCDRLITPNFEVEIKAKLLDTDGSFGIRGKVYTGEEEYIAGIIASEMAKGGLAVAQYKYLRDLGIEASNIGKAQIFQGLINSSNEMTDYLREKMQSKTTKVFVNGGANVLVYFDKSVSFSSQKLK